MYDRSRALLQLTSPAGTDTLIPTALSAQEAVNEPYSYRLSLVSEKSEIDPKQLLRQPGCVTLRRDSDLARYFAGVFQDFTAQGTTRDGMSAYSALLVPGFWFLCQTIDCRIFQNKSVVDILQQMFNDAGVQRVDFRITGDRSPLPYTTQFNETDFHFAGRLMEQAGYFYFFEHAADGETLVIADSNIAFPDIPQANLRFNAVDAAEDVLTNWNKPGATAWGLVRLKDYDPTDPGNKLQGQHDAAQQVGQPQQRDVFLWPAVTFENQVVNDRARLMIEASNAAVSQSSSSSTFRGLVAGGRFNLMQDPLGGAGGSYIVTRLSVDVIDETWTTSGASSDYLNNFTCMPDSVPWRQPLQTPRPRMAGVHSAIVIGPEGEEIYTDKLGRVKVRFFWDWRSEADPAQAIWARVVQPWAGNQWGAQFIPRVGTEVAVAFVDNDPDRPVVLGGLYNGDQTPIYPSEAEKTKSGFRSRSSLGGSSDDFNEFTFDDKSGEERVYLKAQRDLATEVLHDATHTVGHDRTRTVGNDETVGISGKQTVTITGNRAVEITQGNDGLQVDQGDISVSASLGKITIQAMQSIELTVGSSTIRIDPTGISISALTVSISGEAMASMSAPVVSISGDGETTISGGIVMINS